MSSKRIDAIRDALEAIRLATPSGRLTREAVVRAAKHPKHILHREFNWNDKKAAHLQRLDRAQEIITRYVTVITIDKSLVISAPYYVRDPWAKTNQAGYVSLTSEDIKQKDAIQIIIGEVDRCASNISRARNVAAVLDTRHPGISARLERMLQALIDLRGDLKAAA